MGIKDEFRTGIIYSAIGKYSNVIISLIVNAILSRILTPGEYGVVAVVNVFLVFFQMLADFGIGPAIIQNKSLDNKDIQSIFSFTIILSVVLALLFMLLGYPISIFYNSDVYVPISMLLGICILFYTLSVVPQAIIQKRKDFKTINIALIWSNVISAVVSIAIGYLDGSYYALVFGNIIRALYLFLYYLHKSKLSLRLAFDSTPLLKIYHFSKNQFLFSFINYFSINLDNILIGRFFSTSALAYYNKAYTLSLYPNQVLTSVITPVIQPIMSNYEQSIEQIKKVYFMVTTILANIGIPLSVFLFFSAEEIILFLFGDQWMGSVMAFMILSATVWIQMIQSSTGSIFQSANRTDLLLLSGVITSIINVTAIISGVVLGNIEFVATLIFISFSINFIINNYIMMHLMFKSHLLEFFKVLVKPLLMGMLQIMAFMLLPELPFQNFTVLMLKGVLFVIMFLLGIFVTRQQSIIRRVIGKK